MSVYLIVNWLGKILVEVGVKVLILALKQMIVMSGWVLGGAGIKERVSCADNDRSCRPIRTCATFSR